MEWECHQCGTLHEEIPKRCRECGTAPEIVLNRWRCAHCGEAEIAGTDERCPACGAPKGLDVESRVDASARLQGQRALDLARGDWLYCAFCDQQVPPVNEAGEAQTSCPNCDGPLTEAAQRAAVEQLSAEDAAEYRQVKTESVAEEEAQEEPAPAPQKPRRKGNPLAGCLLLLLLLGLVGGGIYLLFFKTWTEQLTVAARAWQRTVAVERFGPVQQEGWRAELPARAYNTSCSRKIHHYNKIPDGTEEYEDRVATGKRCAEHGYKKKGGVSVKTCLRWEKTYKTVTKTRTRYRRVPVFASHCRYTVDRWHEAEPLSAAGSGKEAPRWPDTSGLDGKRARAGARSERYTLDLRDDEGETETYTCADLSEWQRFRRGAAVVAQTSLTGTIEGLQPAP